MREERMPYFCAKKRMAQVISVGVAGYGKSAKVFHLPFITTMDGFALTAVLERHHNEAASTYPGIRTARSIEELVSDKALDLVIVTTPNTTHFEYAAKALQAGKHVILEKPFTITTAEGRELIEIAKQSGRILSVYQNRRYVSDYFTIRDILQKNVLGEVHEFNATYDRYRPEAIPGAWRETTQPGAGILYDLGPHLLDQVLSLFGHPAAITADVRKQRPHAQADDYFNIWLDFGFLKVILHAGMLVRQQGPRYMIQGTRGSFLKYGEDPQEEALKAGRLPGGEQWGQEPEAYFGTLHTAIDGRVVNEVIPSHKGDYAQYFRNVYDAIVLGKPVQERPEDGYNTIRLIELAFESSRVKKTLECTGLLK